MIKLCVIFLSHGYRTNVVIDWLFETKALSPDHLRLWVGLSPPSHKETYKNNTLSGAAPRNPPTSSFPVHFYLGLWLNIFKSYLTLDFFLDCMGFKIKKHWACKLLQTTTAGLYIDWILDAGWGAGIVFNVYKQLTTRQYFWRQSVDSNFVILNLNAIVEFKFATILVWNKIVNIYF